MTTWEMIKKLTENPKLKFINQDGDTAELDGYGILKLYGSGDFIDTDGNIRVVDGINERHKADKWELVRNQVTWQEALEAWVKGINVIRELDGTSCMFRANTLFTVSRNELINGKWYIE